MLWHRARVMEERQTGTDELRKPVTELAETARGFESHRHPKETSPHLKGTRARKSHMVGAVGLEPTILAARDFKSPAYANSATPP